MKSKHEEKARLCYALTGRFMVYMKQNIFVEFSKDVETRFGTSNEDTLNLKILKPVQKQLSAIIK